MAINTWATAGKDEMEERSRLEALRRYRVLDTDPEEALDELVNLAATICAAPIALITLVDEKRQWFMARVGTEIRESPLDLSICVHALRLTDLLIVPDATLDERFAKNPLVTGVTGVRFYAGAPLITPGGEVLGTLCVIDRVPRQLSALQMQSLRVLSRQVMANLELRRHRLELAKSERLLRAVFDAERECVQLVDSAGGLDMMNTAGLAMIEADSFEEVSGSSILPLVAGGQRAAFTALTERVFRGESGTLEHELLGLKGTRRWMETHATPVRDEEGKITAMLGISRDLSENRRTAEELRASETRYRTLFEYAPDGILITDVENRYIDANVSACRMLGYSRQELIGLQATDVVATSEIPHIESALAAIRAWPGYHREWQFRRKDGSLFAADVMAKAMPDGNLLGMMRDLTARRRAEDRFRWLVDSNAQGVMFWNMKGETTGGNDAFLRLVGYTREDLEAGRIEVAALTPPEYADLDRRAAEEILLQGYCTPYEKEYIRKDGSRVSILLGAATFEANPEEGACTMLDLTERKKVEEQAYRAQRMESIGTLAGGIAHDLNNTLGPIILSLDLLQMNFPDEESQELIAIISASARRGAAMVRQVLSFARGVEGQRTKVQIKHLLGEVEKITNDTFPKNIEIRTDVARHLWAVMGDPTQLHQVMLNLCLNARDAMPGGGVLTLTAENLEVEAHDTALGWNGEAKPGPYVLLQVKDTGTGISPPILEKIFDPFFTTKDIGKGTGLGLSTTLAIIKSHGGFIRVQSEVGTGTTFSVYLSAQLETSSAAIAEREAEMPRGNGELVLVVDDELPVRQITQQTLLAYGYRVVLACNGTEGVAIYTRQGSEIALVLTDMMMPVMDGPTMIRVLQAFNPKLPIVAVSGISSVDPEARAAQLGVSQFLPKPYTVETLLKALKEALA